MDRGCCKVTCDANADDEILGEFRRMSVGENITPGIK